ncbi:Type VI secretion, VasB, ImpH, VC_A0111 [Pseudomonas delhiensis]|uniref:Type VI secretion, VasB, ImpH, VC_A0111 n=1 Tax=Pseudomonas delhiensis TaxID=366289 RepID=A0A239N5R3_9PSED|nr:type VI secretion system baseplate subunit TssG [Pseudomonas delhiensis]SDK52092.1 Type VI secretion, VasB, ImpH, VC_A0111 [Pseudomonas delhiensis]SNT49813.1 Type VI secretion, VasB, ImpH, VC_A0111 [Pseudomonas delhiensis]
MEREPQSAYSRLKASGLLDALAGRISEANLYRFCQLVEVAAPGNPPLGTTTRPGDDAVRFRPHPGMGFPAGELKAIEYDEEHPERPPTVRTRLLGLIGLGIPGTANHIATPVSRFLALLSVMRLPTRNAEGISALVKLLAPNTQVRVTPHWPRKVPLAQPASLSREIPVSLSQGTPLGSVGADANSQVRLELLTEDLTEAQGWLPGQQLHTDLLVPLRVYLGWRCTAKLALTLPVKCLPKPVLGGPPVWLGLTGVLGLDPGNPDPAEQPCITVNLGRYQGLIQNMKPRETQHVAYRI